MVTKIDVSEIDESIQEEIKDYLIRVASDLVNNAKEEAPVSSGRLRQSIQIQEQGENEILVGTNLEYAPYIEFGTEPHYPPIEPLKKWVRRKLNVEEDVAYAVQQKIGQEGTEPNPFMDRAIERTRDRFR